MEITLENVLSAADLMRGVIHHTPVHFSKTFSDWSDSKIFLKLENLQKTGSFKVRGAYYKLAKLSEEEKKKGVVTASAGNHAQGVAFASSLLGIPCTIVMPETASSAKVSATRSYGVATILHGKTFDDALLRAKSISEKTGSILVHAFDDSSIIIGQATVGLEILQDLPEVEVIVVPIGGGGLISGVSFAVKNMNPRVKIIGVQSTAFPSMVNSLKEGRRVKSPAMSTIADGIAVRGVGKMTFELTRKYVDDVMAVDDEDIAKAVFLLMERAKTVVEPAGAVGLAAILAGKIRERGKSVVVLLSGGNIDMYLLGQLVSRSLHGMRRLMRLAFQVRDQPGALRHIIDTIAESCGNIVDIQHERLSSRVSLGKVEVTLSLETRDETHSMELLKNLQDKGIKYVEMP